MSGPDEKTPGAVAADRALEIERSEIVGDGTGVDKKFATLAAHLALKGFALHRLTCGGYLIARWDRTAYAPDLRGVSAFLDRTEGR